MEGAGPAMRETKTKFAEKDLRDNWRKYRENFLREANKND